ncbi:MAG: hypothetical protein NTV30_00450 [Chloroflexi bacterium]|nr:hypothetical protein [Chloroflexota bacterium]
MAFDTKEAEKKVISILKILSNCREPMGARLIAYQLKNYGVELGERAVRYHLKMTDERGLTKLIGRDGRLLTEKGQEEINSARIAFLSYQFRYQEPYRNGSVKCLLLS